MKKEQKEIFIKITKGSEVLSFISLPYTKNYKEIILKWLKNDTQYREKNTKQETEK